MEGFKLIKTSFQTIKRVVGVHFNGEDDYNIFLNQVKKVYGIKEDLELNVYSNDFEINSDIFSIFVSQYICSTDFVLNIKLLDAENSAAAINAEPNVNSNHSFSSTSCTHENLIAFQEQPLVKTFTYSSDTELLNLSQDFVLSPAISLNEIPSTDDIKRMHVIQKLLTDGNTLENRERTKIAKTIISYILKHNPNYRLLKDDFLELSNSIVDIFPSEVRATYYIPFANGHLAKGKLYDAYNNSRVRLSALGIIQRRVKSKPKEANSELNFNSLNNNEGVQCLIEVLKTGCVEWNLILENWRKTHSFRRNELQNEQFKTIDYIEKYKVFQNVRSYELFDVDFQILYPNSKNICELKNYYKKIIEKANRIKDNPAKEILVYIEKAEDNDSKLALWLMLVPYLLPTARKKSKLEVQLSFICYCNNILNADDETRNSIKRIKLETQPKIYFIGTVPKL